MQAGRLDRLVELRHVLLTPDASTGQQVESWPTAYATVWASKRDIRGREFYAAQQNNSDVTTVWQLRYRSDVVTTDVIVYDGLQYNITAIAELGRRDGLEIQATAVRP
jgi:SPP1 family predicted phage head-tail adaptor